jgi:hypothetical protein
VGIFPKFHIQTSANNPKTIAVKRKEKQKEVVTEISVSSYHLLLMQWSAAARL